MGGYEIGEHFLVTSPEECAMKCDAVPECAGWFEYNPNIDPSHSSPMRTPADYNCRIRTRPCHLTPRASDTEPGGWVPFQRGYAVDNGELDIGALTGKTSNSSKLDTGILWRTCFVIAVCVLL